MARYSHAVHLVDIDEHWRGEIIFFRNGGRAHWYKLTTKRRATLEKMPGYYNSALDGGFVLPVKKEDVA